MRVYLHPLDGGLAPAWAEEWGQDSYGVWAAFVVGDVSHRMRWIPPGRFLMGSHIDENEAADDERPQHLVHVRDGFWLGEAPCTQGLWEAVRGQSPSHFEGKRRPVEKVTLDNVDSFLETINQVQPGLSLGLPTEQQWEYACRAGTEGRDYGEGQPLDSLAWYRQNSERQTHDVELKSPNAWGLHDMLGNVGEWTASEEKVYSLESSNGESPLRGGDSGRRAIRGGSCFYHAENVRAGCRHWGRRGHAFGGLGFRLFRGQGIPVKPGAAEPRSSGRP